MKLIAYILSIYIIFLVTLPCADEFFIPHSTNTSISAENSNNSDCQDLHLCSPFCICACCSTVVEVVNTLLFSKPFFNVIVNYSFYKTVKINSLSFSVWQPPKL